MVLIVDVYSARSKWMDRRWDKTGVIGVPGENDNGRRVEEFCAERGMCVVTHILNTELCLRTRVAKGQGRVEIKSILDLVLVKRDMLRYIQDVRVVRGMGCGLSDQHVVLCKVRLVGGWIKKRGGVWG